MLASFSEFKFFQSFRVPVESMDDIRFLVEAKNEQGNWDYINDAKLLDVSATGVGFSSMERISSTSDLKISIHFKKLNLDLEGTIVRSFTGNVNMDDDLIVYGVEIDDTDTKAVQRFLEQYIYSFSTERLRDCFVQVALTDRYSRASEGFEMFSLILSLFKDMTNFGEKQEFVETMLEEVVRVLNATRASIFLINPDSNELEAVAALGIEKDLLKFDYRKGVAGSVFTTGVSLNIDVSKDSIRYSEKVDLKTGFKTKSIICCPIYNREDKVIGVIEVLNKRNESMFTVEDEKTMKVLALIFSSVFHNYNPISDLSRIRRFSTPYDRDNVLIGTSKIINDLRHAIVRLKDLDTPILVSGEKGVGKTVVAKIIHEEGRRGLNPFRIVDCRGTSKENLEASLFGGNEASSQLEQCQGGTLIIDEISLLPIETQERLVEVLSARRIDNSEITLDTRLISTSSMDLRKMVDVEGTFNKELFEHISGGEILVGPLRKRKEDVQGLVEYFVRKECKEQGLLLKVFSPAVMDTFVHYDWPENVSEVQEAVSKAVLYNPKVHIISNISNSAMPIIDKRKTTLGSMGEIEHVTDHSISLKERVALVEREIIMAEIKRHNGNKSKAAKAMGISREALRKKLINSDGISFDLENRVSNIKKAA